MNGRERKKQKLRALDKSHIEIILNVLSYSQEKQRIGKPTDPDNFVKKTAAATGISTGTIKKIKTHSDVDNRKHKEGMKVKVNRKMVVPDIFTSVIRKTIRDLFLVKQRILTVDTAFKRMQTYTASDIAYCNIDGTEVINGDMQVWVWSRSTRFRYMKNIGFVYRDRLTYYEHAKTKFDNISLRDSYLEWIQKYREDDYDIFFKMKHGFSRI